MRTAVYIPRKILYKSDLTFSNVYTEIVEPHIGNNGEI